jgi:hypothetical protein
MKGEDMDPLPLDFPQDSDESLRALAGQYVDRHSGIENYLVIHAAEFWLLRRLGLEPSSWLGRLVAYLFHFLLVLLPALILTTVTGQWADVPLLSWLIVAIVYGAIGSLAPPMVRTSVSGLLSWLWTIVDAGDLQRLIAWERRWYNYRVTAPVSAALTLGTALPLYFLGCNGPCVSAPAGTLYVGGFAIFVALRQAFSLALMAPEAHSLSTCRYKLYRLSPADSVAVRQSLRGYNRLGAINVLVTTTMILLLLLLLPADSGVVIPLVLSLLLVEYVCTALGALVPRLLMGRIIQTSKETEMEILQAQLDELLPRIRELSEAEYEEMTRLQATHDTIRDSPDSLLPLGAILRTAGALLLSTATILATAFAEEWLGALAQRFVP